MQGDKTPAPLMKRAASAGSRSIFLVYEPAKAGFIIN